MLFVVAIVVVVVVDELPKMKKLFTVRNRINKLFKKVFF